MWEKWILFLTVFSMVECQPVFATDTSAIGIKERDDFFDQYRACADEKVPAAQRDDMTTTVTQLRLQTKVQANSVDDKRAMGDSCIKARAMRREKWLNTGVQVLADDCSAKCCVRSGNKENTSWPFFHAA